MARNIDVSRLDQVPIERQQNEMVERKGLGHPDSVADGLAEAVSRSLCKEYMKRYSRILHHNTDECQVIAGLANPRFGGGTVIQPVKVTTRRHRRMTSAGRTTSAVQSPFLVLVRFPPWGDRSRECRRDGMPIGGYCFYSSWDLK